MAQTSFLVIPDKLQDLSPEWLTHALRQSGTLQNSSVISVEILSESIGNGIAGQISRIGLHYDRVEEDQPRTLVVKRPVPDPKRRAYLQNVFGIYAREAFFYQEIAGKLKTRSPRCYYSAYTSDPLNMMLLLEDLTGYENGDWLTGCTLEQARIILREMAFLHSAWWKSPELDEMEPLLRFKNFPLSDMEQEFTAQWPSVLEGLGQLQSYRDTCKALEGKIEPAFMAISSPPLALAHHDIQIDNMVFGKPPDQAPFILLDWAMVGVANPAFDLAYFMSRSLDTSLRRAHEREMIGEYLTTLTGHGILDYTLDTCLRDYRLMLISILQRSIWVTYRQLPLTDEEARMKGIILSRILETIMDSDEKISRLR